MDGLQPAPYVTTDGRYVATDGRYVTWHRHVGSDHRAGDLAPGR
jgi:hypothetical protein